MQVKVTQGCEAADMQTAKGLTTMLPGRISCSGTPPGVSFVSAVDVSSADSHLCGMWEFKFTDALSSNAILTA